MLVSTSIIFPSANLIEYVVFAVDGTMPLKGQILAEVRLLSTRFYVLAIIMSIALTSGTDNQEKDEKQSQNDKTGLGMEKTVKDKAKSTEKSTPGPKLNLLHLIVNLEAFEVISSYKLIELIAQGIEAREPLGQLFRPLTQKEWPWF
ncbi:hypothetical protein Tco_0158943 [Tanacetum coccineum]